MGILRQVSRTECSCSRRVFRPLEMRLLSRSNTRVVVATHLFCGAVTTDRHRLFLTPQELPQAQCHKQHSPAVRFASPSVMISFSIHTTILCKLFRADLLVLVSEVVDLVDSIIRSTVCELLLVPVTQKPIAWVPTHTHELEHVVHSRSECTSN